MWHSIQANGNPPIARSGTQAVMYNGCVYIFGGYTKKDGDYFNDVYRFNTIDDSWQEVLPTSVQDLPEPRTDHSLVTH